MDYLQNTVKDEGSAHRTGQDIFLQGHYSEAGSMWECGVQNIRLLWLARIWNDFNGVLASKKYKKFAGLSSLICSACELNHHDWLDHDVSWFILILQDREKAKW